jgi:hypothetical protein
MWPSATSPCTSPSAQSSSTRHSRTEVKTKDYETKNRLKEIIMNGGENSCLTKQRSIIKEIILYTMEWRRILKLIKQRIN